MKLVPQFNGSARLPVFWSVEMRGKCVDLRRRITEDWKITA
jgi:hypothetical protein